MRKVLRQSLYTRTEVSGKMGMRSVENRADGAEGEIRSDHLDNNLMARDFRL